MIDWGAYKRRELEIRIGEHWGNRLILGYMNWGGDEMRGVRFGVERKMGSGEEVGE